MTRLRKILLVLGGAAAAAVGAAVFLPGAIVNMSPVRERLEDALSDALNMPVKIETAGYSPASGLVLSGLSVPSDPVDWLGARRVSVRARLLPLLSRHLVIDEIRIEDPSVDWRQDGSGRFTLPVIQRVEEARPAPARAATEAPAAKPADFQFELRRVAIENGTLILRDGNGAMLLALAGATLRAAPGSTPSAFAGVVEAASLRFGDSAEDSPSFIERARIPFAYTSEGMDLQGIDATLAGGTVRGRGYAAIHTPKQPARFHVQIENVSFARLMSAFGEEESALTGQLKGTVGVSGELADLNNRSGKIELVLDGGQLNQHPFLQTAGFLLGLPELITIQLETAFLTATLNGAETAVDALTLAGETIRLDASGLVKADGGLDLDAALGVRNDVLKKIPSEIRRKFQSDTAREGWSRVPFEIEGTLEKPKSRLEQALTGGSIESLILNTLGLGGDDE